MRFPIYPRLALFLFSRGIPKKRALLFQEIELTLPISIVVNSDLIRLVNAKRSEREVEERTRNARRKTSGKIVPIRHARTQAADNATNYDDLSGSARRLQWSRFEEMDYNRIFVPRSRSVRKIRKRARIAKSAGASKIVRPVASRIQSLPTGDLCRHAAINRLNILATASSKPLRAAGWLQHVRQFRSARRWEKRDIALDRSSPGRDRSRIYVPRLFFFSRNVPRCQVTTRSTAKVAAIPSVDSASRERCSVV